VCPQCKKRYEEDPFGISFTHCPDDNAALVSVRDMADADGDPMLGRTLDNRYTILAKLGAGSMGTVYRARQQAIGRDIAVKILRSDRALDEASKGRFLREARANSVLTSPHTVTVFDFGQSETGELFLAMELLEGESLGQRLKRETRLGVTSAVDMVRQALRSLGEAHAKGIVHRDLKPDNLFYARVLNANKKYEEIVKVVDFGIAKMLTGDGEAMNAIETQAGTVFGTPRYMSPEQAQGKPLDARSDLYSLAVILYHALTGRPPFTDDDAIVVMARHIKTLPKTLSEVAPDASIPTEVEAVVMRTLSKDPDQRPETAEVMAQMLQRAVELGVANVSGVRVSTAPQAFARALEVTPGGSVRPPPMQPAAPRIPDDSLSMAAGMPQKRSSGLVVGIAVGAFVCVLGLALIVYFALARKSGESNAAAPNVSATSSASVATPKPTQSAASASTASSIPTINASSLFANPAPSGAPTQPTAGTGARGTRNTAPPPATTTASPPATATQKPKYTPLD
jgi:serine/threonine-protein kinase